MRIRFGSVLIAIVIFVIGLNAGYIFGQSPWAPFNAFTGAGLTPPTDRQATDAFLEAWDLVQTRYYRQPVDDDVLIQGAIDGMLGTLGDQYTRYLPPQDEVRSQEQMDGQFQGIGVVVENVDGAITVVSPIEGSPAEAAGLQPGDILRQADGIDLDGLDLTEAADIIRGPQGTLVNLVVEREGEQLVFDIERDTIVVPSVRGEMLDDGIAYVRINQFIRTTESDLQAILRELNESNPTGLILDLRRNPGGLLDQVQDVADEFLPSGVVLVEEFGSGQREVYESTEQGLAETIPMVVLIDEGSASAAEVLAGAIRDRERGILIGTQSFGKGTIQSVNGLSNGGGLRITIARWLTPTDRWVHEEGLTPDFVINWPEDLTTLAEGEDPQLQAAIDYLLGRPVVASETSTDVGEAAVAPPEGPATEVGAPQP
jgi:carboxyl-terminal processing protease